MGLAEPRPQRKLVAPTEAVEQVELSRGQRELAVLVLAEERDQAPTERLEVRGRRRAALYEGASPTLAVHAPGEHELGWYLAVELLDALAQLAQLWLVEQAVGQLEHPFDVGLAPPADDPGARLAAQQQVEGVSEHGLAGAGLAGDRREVRAWAQLRPLDQQGRFSIRSSESTPAGLPAPSDGPEARLHPRAQTARVQYERPNLSRRRW